ncbi:DEAD/DEAH box helicase [Microlunatus soli]|uniref:Superfamily II DNA and RNA helicase n=1 Tax=Microlunatus soli TaxID=630515 RepID=A0A1H1WV50_9ACTN|nr:DEAD/DEAH box helicase [Microlunatus soli]SDT01083.1 Superfamily II DNA and RNA helicase [Microlunatus soli]
MPSAGSAASSAGKKTKRHQRSDPNSSKRRWTAAERAAKGRKPRRRGGVDDTFDRNTSSRERGFEGRMTRTDDRRDGRRSDDRRNDRRSDDRGFDRGFNRSDDRGFNRSDDRGFNRGNDRGDNRGDSRGYNRGDDRPRNDRFDRSGSGRSDRPRGDRFERPSNGRSDRPRGDRYDRPRADRFDRSNNDRSDRPQGGRGAESRGRRWDEDRPAQRDRSGDRRPNRRDDRDVAQRDISLDVRADRTEQAAPAALETPDVNVGFADLGVATELVDRLAADGILTPFPIQAASIPDAVSGRDVLGRGRTGSGKTLGFGLPMLTRLTAGKRRREPRGLILLPTRELATQVSDVLAPLARAVGLRTMLVAGGMSYVPQLKALDNGVDIVIGTPGRLIDLMERGDLLLDFVEITVLDEADHMADLGFLPDVTTLLDAVPSTGQRMLFSATLDRGVDRVVQQYLHDPSTHQVDTAQASVDTMTHYLLPIAPSDKRTITAEIANRDGRTVIFVRTQLGADRVAEQLREAGVMAGALHGGLPQGARTRTLEAFKTGTLPVLVATDVAARGIHVDEVGLVLQVDPPTDPKTYLHRSGRTARAGQAGVVVTLVLPNQRRQIRRLAQDAGVTAVQLDARPGDEALAEATGSLPTNTEPISEREYAKVIAPRQPKRGPGGRGQGGRGQGGRQGGFGGKGRGWNRHGGRGPEGRGPGARDGRRGGDGFDRRKSGGDRQRATYDNGR